MNNPAAQAAAFYRSVARTGCVWTLRDVGGYATPLSAAGRRAQPFWSSRFRALRVVRMVPAYRDFEPVLLTWHEFRDQWLPSLEHDGILVGVNWSGPRAVGYDLEPMTVAAKCQRAMSAYERETPSDTPDRSRAPRGPARIRAAARRLPLSPAMSDEEPDRRTAGGER